MKRINYLHLAKAIVYYESLGFQYLELPWTVIPRALNVTKPPECETFIAGHLGCLVASGEQSFIQEMLHKSLYPGRYVCCTPCFRDEPVLDEYHLNTFMKVELISAYPENGEEELQQMIEFALQFFRSHHITPKVVQTQEGFDIECNGIELGSYGIREYQDLRWVYGTGVAEPRLSQTIEKSWSEK